MANTRIIKTFFTIFMAFLVSIALIGNAGDSQPGTRPAA